MTQRVYARAGRSSIEGRRLPSTVRTSSRRRASTTGWAASRAHVHPDDVESPNPRERTRITHIRLPTVKRSDRRIDHRRDEAPQAIGMKRGLRKTALPSPQVPLAAEQPLADEHLRLGEQRTLAVVPMIDGQNVLQVIRMAHEIELKRTDLKPHQIAEPAYGVRAPRQGVAAQARRAEGRGPYRPWGLPVPLTDRRRHHGSL